MRKSWLLIVLWLLAAVFAGCGGGAETKITISSTQAPAEPTETPPDPDTDSIAMRTFTDASSDRDSHRETNR